jgi:hypothetical protein
MDAARRADLGFTAAVIVTAAVFLHQAWRLPSSRFDPLGPGAFPIAICILLLALSAIGLVSVLRGRSLGRAETSLIVGLDEEAGHRRRPALAAFVFAATIAYALVLQFAPVDFSVATAFYVAVTGVAMSRRTRRHVLIAVAVGVGAGAGLTLVFGGLLGLVLP